jgi:pimeloyl-ACP methyl ester carboxylesterase
MDAWRGSRIARRAARFYNQDYVLADDAARFINEEVGGLVHFVGLSMGGMTAQSLVSSIPGAARSITVANFGHKTYDDVLPLEVSIAAAAPRRCRKALKGLLTPRCSATHLSFEADIGVANKRADRVAAPPGPGWSPTTATKPMGLVARPAMIDFR